MNEHEESTEELLVRLAYEAYHRTLVGKGEFLEYELAVHRGTWEIYRSRRSKEYWAWIAVARLLSFKQEMDQLPKIVLHIQHDEEENKPLDEKEQVQLIEIMQIFMQLPNRNNIELHFSADAGGSLYNDGEMTNHFHDLEEGVDLMRWLANSEQEEE